MLTEPDFRVSRALPLDAALLPAVVDGLQRASATPTVRWRLGDRGGVDIDVRFVESPEHNGETERGRVLTTSAWLWTSSTEPSATAVLELVALGTDSVELSCRSAGTTGCARRQMEDRDAVGRLLDLAHAAVDELAEELLWHATRPPAVRRTA